ncbi:MAG: NAD(+)/NADH kinase [Chloroflexota bacterium]
MTQIALVYQPYKPDSTRMADVAASWLDERGYKASTFSAFDLDGKSPPAATLAVAFGGDGTTLRAARWFAETSTPVLSVRMGTLSFLGEVDPDELFTVLPHYLKGDYWVEERAMLKAEFDGQTAFALNDIVVARGGALRAVRVEVGVDGEHVTRYLADGIIVSTATGSTAYSLAAGGPVVAPELRCMVLTPIAPHLNVLHSLVVGEMSTIQLTPLPGQDALITVDGQQDVPLAPGMAVSVQLAKRQTRFARRGPRGVFYRSIAAKLHR